MVITTEQLQVAYKAIYGEEAGDIHRLRASFHFNVPYEQVTIEQRLDGKAINFGYYGIDTKSIHVSTFRPRKNWSFRPTI